MLPKIDHPIFNVEVPSLKKKFKFRPFLVKEEKILLMAKESNDFADILGAVSQIVNNCSLDPTLDINILTQNDLETIFLKLRAASINNVVSVSYKDKEDNKVYSFDIDLNEIKSVYPEQVDKNIKINNECGLVMKFPSASLYQDKEFLSLEKDYMFELIIRCIDSIYIKDEVYSASDYSKEDLSEFLENLDLKVFERVQKFLLSAPKLEYKIEYKNSLGNERTIILSSLNDFFTWQ